MENRSIATGEFRVNGVYCQQFLARNEGVTLEPSTVETYDSHLKQYETFLTDRGTTIVGATFDDLLDFIARRVRVGNRQSTIEGMVSTIGRIYRYIRLHTEAGDELNFDPLRIKTIDLEQYNTPEPLEREALSRTELRKLFDAFESYRNRLMAIVGVETGLRNSDIRGIRLADLSLEAREIHVHNPKNSKPYDVPISADLSFEIDYWIRHHRAGFDSNGECEFLFPSQKGGQIQNNGSLNRYVKEAAEKAGIQGTIGRTEMSPEYERTTGSEGQYREWHRVTVHTLRHSCLTLMKEDGVDLTYRQLVANHANPKTTQGYTHSSNEAFDAIRNQFTPPR